MVEQDTDRIMITSQWEFSDSHFPGTGKPIRFAQRPIQSIQSITYDDAEGAAQTIPAGEYELDIARREIFLLDGAAWPQTSGFGRSARVNYTAGYGSDGVAVPWYLKRAVLAACEGEFFGWNPDRIDAYRNLIQRVIPSHYIAGPMDT